MPQGDIDPLLTNAWSRRGTLRLNAWHDGDTFAAQRTGYETYAPLTLPSNKDWQHPDVGWGLVLPDAPGLDRDALERAEDAPEPIRSLLTARATRNTVAGGLAPVLRYDASLPAGKFRRYDPGVRPQTLDASAHGYGTGLGCIPRYLLIYGSPEVIPWHVQYNLSINRHVGRLDLTDPEGLGTYIEALLAGWPMAPANPARPLIWSARSSGDVMGALMQRAVGDRLDAVLGDDKDIEMHRYLNGEAAVGEALIKELGDLSPGLVVTTSHGNIDVHPEGLGLETLGSLIGSDNELAATADIVAAAPAGVIWYAHACASAGSDRPSTFSQLFEGDQAGGADLAALADHAGARVAPLPRALLGRKDPIRAFVGHVEPTFAWTLGDPDRMTVLPSTVVACLYTRLYQPGPPAPLGWALEDLHREGASFLAGRQDATHRSLGPPLYRKLAGHDRLSTVIIGDPVVALPKVV
ncbi:hypothetical protein [Roseibium sp. MMSF_3412]|uniref:hypothetical protein n=1 Tax=Roseibium sp. MMSF_3412 TaxID=3046712 RepID=UPI00273EE0C8|nr:hypothetical protein [Roseibium sp. MMSF_3412]